MSHSVVRAFFSYHTTDKEKVGELANKLREKGAGIEVWFAETDLRPGAEFLVETDRQITVADAAVVFLGHEVGQWQSKEVQKCLIERQKRGSFSVIPVLLPNFGGDNPKTPFFENLKYVDYQKESESAIDELIWGITGQRPSELQVASTSLETEFRNQ